MIDTETVFVLGAGASVPYGYPTGDELRRLIIRGFPRKADHDDYCVGLEKDEIEDIVDMARILSDKFENARSPSIDIFLARRPEFYEIGRRAIAQIIHEKEKISVFEYDMDDPEKDWYKYLFHRMTETLTDKESYMKFSENKVSFITFNYDRSLEHYLYNALINSFDIPLGRIRTEDLFPFEFILVYGKLADLNWENSGGIRYRGAFVPKMISNINIIYDTPNKDELKESIHRIFTKAKRIFFLGFGYAHENLEVIKVIAFLKDDIDIYGTCYGSTPKNINDLKSKLSVNIENKVLLSIKPVLENKDCCSLLREYL